MPTLDVKSWSGASSRLTEVSLKKNDHPKKGTTMSLNTTLSAVALLAVLTPTLLAAAQEPNEWSSYGGDPGGQRYSPLTQIDRTNVSRLEIAWRYDTGELGENARDGQKLTFELTPIVFEGLLYIATAYGKVVALDPASGSEEWVFDAAVNRRRNYSEVTNRGVTAWRDAQARSTDACASRIFFGTIDAPGELGRWHDFSSSKMKRRTWPF